MRSDLNSSPTILIVDDNSDDRKKLHDQLAEWGYLVKEASNGIDALTLMENNDVSLVMTDLLMPILNGLEVMGELRKQVRFGGLPILVLSGIRPSQREHCVRAGADEYVEKPWDPSELKHLLDLHLQCPPNSKLKGDPKKCPKS